MAEVDLRGASLRNAQLADDGADLLISALTRADLRQTRSP